MQVTILQVEFCFSSSKFHEYCFFAWVRDETSDKSDEILVADFWGVLYM